MNNRTGFIVSLDERLALMFRKGSPAVALRAVFHPSWAEGNGCSRCAACGRPASRDCLISDAYVTRHCHPHTRKDGKYVYWEMVE